MKFVYIDYIFECISISIHALIASVSVLKIVEETNEFSIR